jgi:photosystem II stability/assembly factor-like uncharacterized protein
LLGFWICAALAASGAVQGAVQEPVPEKDKKTPELDAGLLSGLELRAIGPAFMSGRIADIAIDPTAPNTWYVAAGSGNLWKTTNAGTTFEPIFDKYGSYSIGCVAIDPGNPRTIWVGTGEDVGGRHVGYGDGVYKSRDGGKSFTNVGLAESEHIARILIDPKNGDVVYVAAQGPLWSAGGQRGLYKTTDGGTTWSQILGGGPYTGVTDVIMDPRDSSVLYAATHQRHRTVSALINGGPESGIHKSRDGGQTWQKLTQGLPGEDMGKIGLALARSRPEVLYATIELAGRTGGFWSSEDGGMSWSKKSDYVSGGTGPHYYQELWADPHRFDVVYQANVVLGRTDDGGATWKDVGNDNKHVDNHAVAFHPSDPDFLLIGCDGGLYRSSDRGATFSFFANLPLTQFYKVDVDYDWPVYHLVGGTQDNNTQYGPVRTLTDNGIQNCDWRITIGGDGHDCAIDPTDPNIIYCESQQGVLRRFDRRSGESIDIRPRPERGEHTFRFNWDSPIHISPHDPRRIYFGSKLLHRSDDRGDSWRSISPDLSRGQDRLLLKVMDRVWSVDAVWDLYAMSEYGNVTSISESPLVEGLIYAGTDDGLIQVTEDGGESWRKIDRIYGVPEYAFVNDVKADRHAPDTVYAALDHHKSGDYAPYLVKSTDRGRTWNSIAGDLPKRHLVWRVIQDHVRADLLFAATEFGVFCTLDGGVRWIKLTGGVPTISFRDLEIQRRENDLVAASFGRSFYVLDDYSPLRELSTELLQEEFVLFPVRKALLYVPDDKLGGLKGSQGDGYFNAPNPPYGAVFTYYFRDELKTQKKERRDQEKKAAESGGDTPFPGWERLKAEDRELAPVVFFEIRDVRGGVVDRVEGKLAKGISRTSWNLRYAPLANTDGRGPLVAPGTYSVAAALRVGDEVRWLGEPAEFTVEAVMPNSLASADRVDVLSFQLEAGRLQRAVVGAQRAVEEALDQLKAMQALIESGRHPGMDLWNRARSLELRLKDANDALTGDRTRTQRGATDVPSMLSRVQGVLSATMESTYGPTATFRRQLEIARADYDEAIEGIRQAVEVDLEEIKRQLDEAGAPWTRGRAIPVLQE